MYDVIQPYFELGTFLFLLVYVSYMPYMCKAILWREEESFIDVRKLKNRL
jgi:hypothetical protein